MSLMSEKPPVSVLDEFKFVANMYVATTALVRL